MTALHSGMRSLASALVPLATVLLLVACSSVTQEPVGGSVQAAVPRGPQTQTIIIRDLKFQPAVLTMNVGDTVEWKNEDIVPHNAVSTEPKEFDSDTIAVGSSWKYQTVRKGAFFYNCTLHPNMKAKLVVQ